MKVISCTGSDNIAVVYLAKTPDNRYIEFAESIQPPLKREEKWVIIVSTLYGCPVKCLICDAGMNYHGKMSKEDIFAQIDYVVLKRYPDKNILSSKFKVQFARMGEPAFNNAVLDVLEEFDSRYIASGFIPSVSTIAPASCERFFRRLIQIKNSKYSSGNFQFQFSLHSSDEVSRDKLLPVKKMSFYDMAVLGERFHRQGDNKLTLNFCMINGIPVEPLKIYSFFDPGKFIIKLTPLNPTYKSLLSNLTSSWYNHDKLLRLHEGFQKLGYDVIISEGEKLEDQIGSNCGQYIMTHLRNSCMHSGGYKLVNKSTFLRNEFE